MAITLKRRKTQHDDELDEDNYLQQQPQQQLQQPIGPSIKV